MWTRLAKSSRFDALGDGNWWLKVRVPKSLDRYLVEKGSVTLDGISLTIAAIDGGLVIGVTIIPHTFANTTIGQARVGSSSTSKWMCWRSTSRS